MKATEDAPALPQKIPLHPERAWQPYHGNIIGHLIAHQHLSLNTIVVKGIHQRLAATAAPPAFSLVFTMSTLMIILLILLAKIM